MFVGTETGMYVCIDEDWGILFFINKGTDPYYSPGFFPVLHQLAIYAHNITDVREGINKPIEFSLNQNFPNPFNPATTIIYQLPYSSNITLKIFNTLGEEIETLVNEYKTAGRYQTEFNATNLPSGVYFYQLRAGSFVQTKKMLLLK
jgi:hypothetical protein